MAGPQVDFGRLAGMLFLVCFAAASLLAVVNAKTAPVIAELAAAKAAGSRKSVLPATTVKVDGGGGSFHVDLAAELASETSEARAVLGDDQEGAGFLDVYRGYDESGTITGYAFECELPDGYSGAIRFMMGVVWDPAAGEFVVGGSKILKHGETPGLGANINALSYEEKTRAAAEGRLPVPDFLRSFRGRKRDAVRLRKEEPPGDIDALTAATITSKAYARAMRRVLEVCNRNADLFLHPRAPEPVEAAETSEGGSAHGE